MDKKNKAECWATSVKYWDRVYGEIFGGKSHELSTIKRHCVDCGHECPATESRCEFCDQIYEPGRNQHEA